MIEGVVRPARLELTTPGLEGRCSIRLSYGRESRNFWAIAPRRCRNLYIYVTGRGGGIRTHDPLLPKQMRYQAALRPDTETIL